MHRLVKMRRHRKVVAGMERGYLAECLSEEFLNHMNHL
jgi:hypothetical protein